jgi:hypothetical protein
MAVSLARVVRSRRQEDHIERSESKVETSLQLKSFRLGKTTGQYLLATAPKQQLHHHSNRRLLVWHCW